MRFSTAKFLAGAAALSLVATHAHAQDAAAGSDSEAEEAPPGDIIVTAQRTESLLSQTPLAISAIAGDDLIAQGVTDPTTLGNFVPNIALDRGAQNGLQITIRGVSSNDSTEKGDPSAAFLVDGIVIARPQAQDVAFFDIERVEVLRGPQGTLFGRNSTAGVVHLISARPKDEFEASINASYGNFDAVQATGVLNVPLNENIAVRAAVNYDRRDNYLVDGADDGFTLDPFRDVISGRLSARFQVTDGIDLTLIGDYSSMDGVAQDDLLLGNFFPAAAPFAVAPNSAPQFNPGNSDERRTLAIPQALQSIRDNETYGIAGELNIDIGPGTLTYLGSYRELTRNEIETGVLGLVPFSTTADYEQQSHELRYALDLDRFQAQVGVYYFDEQSNIDVVAQNASVIVPDPPGVGTFGVRQDPTNSESIAVFGQGTYSLTDRFRVTGGLRFTNDQKSREGITFITFPFDIPGFPGFPGAVPANTELPVNVNDAEVEFNEVTWRVGLEYDTAAGLAFASVSRGYKAGGFNDGCEIGTQPACTQPADALFYDPESLIAYEVGTKLSFASGDLRLNATAFLYDYEDLQLSTVAPINGVPTILIQNATTADIFGIEVDALISPKSAQPN